MTDKSSGSSSELLTASPPSPVTLWQHPRTLRRRATNRFQVQKGSSSPVLYTQQEAEMGVSSANSSFDYTAMDLSPPRSPSDPASVDDYGETPPPTQSYPIATKLPSQCLSPSSNQVTYQLSPLSDTPEHSTNSSSHEYSMPTNSSSQTDMDDHDTNDSSSSSLYSSSTSAMSDAQDLIEPADYADTSVPLYCNAPLTTKESWDDILQFWVLNNLTYKAVESLLALLNRHCPSPNNLPKSFFKLKKYYQRQQQQFTRKQYCCKCNEEVSLSGNHDNSSASTCSRSHHGDEKMTELSQLYVLNFEASLARLCEGMHGWRYN